MQTSEVAPARTSAASGTHTGLTQTLAKLSPQDQIEWLTLAVERGLTIEEFRGLFKPPPLDPRPNDVVRCPCCGSELPSGTAFCEQHGLTTTDKTIAGIRYLKCGCIVRGEA